MIGYITRRDEDGTWYLMDIGHGPRTASWTTDKAEALVEISAGEAETLMLQFNEAGYYQVTYHARVA